MKTRSKAYDYARGIAVVLMVAGHITTFPWPLRRVIYSFHMPLFFIIAGAVFPAQRVKGEALARFARKKANALLVPWLLFELIMYGWLVFKNMILPEESTSYIAWRFLGIFASISSNGALSSSLWFLPCMFLAQMAVFGVCKKAARPSTRLLAAALALLAGYGFAYWLPGVFLPWHLEVAPVASAYMLLGLALRGGLAQMDARLASAKAKLFIGLAGIAAGLCIAAVYPASYDMNLHAYGNVAVDLLIIVLVCGGILLVCRCFEPLRLRVLAYFGTNSLAMYGVHMIGTGICNTFIRAKLQGVFSERAVFLASLLSVVLVLIGSSFFAFLYNRYIAGRLPQLGEGKGCGFDRNA